MIVVDSSVWISHFSNIPHREAEILRAIEDVEKILVGDVVLFEVLQGASSDRVALLIESRLAKFRQAPILSSEIARQAAANYRKLRAGGITIRSSIDLIIGTYCIQHGHQLLHRDRDFGHMRQLGLQIYAG